MRGKWVARVRMTSFDGAPRCFAVARRTRARERERATDASTGARDGVDGIEGGGAGAERGAVERRRHAQEDVLRVSDDEKGARRVRGDARRRERGV